VRSFCVFVCQSTDDIYRVNIMGILTYLQVRTMTHVCIYTCERIQRKTGVRTDENEREREEKKDRKTEHNLVVRHRERKMVRHRERMHIFI